MSNYKIKIVSMGHEWKAEGKSVLDTLNKFNLSWEQIKYKGILTIVHKNKSYEHVMNMKALRRLFANKIIRIVWARNFEYLLKNGKTTNIPEVIKVPNGLKEIKSNN